jgi:hypothetical protein
LPASDASRTGPFYVRWHDPAPSNEEYGRAGPAPMLFQNFDDAVRFVMEAVPATSRATAWIDASAGPSVPIDEIVARYDQAAARGPTGQPLHDFRAGVRRGPPNDYWGTSSDPDWRPGSPAGRAGAIEQPDQSWLRPGSPNSSVAPTQGYAEPGYAKPGYVEEPHQIPIGAPPPATNVIPVRGAVPPDTGFDALNRFYSPTDSGGTEPAQQTARGIETIRAVVLITPEDRVQLRRRLDNIEAGFQQILPTLEAIKAALDERPQLGHNHPPEGIDVPPIDTEDLNLAGAAITVARVELGEIRPARTDVLWLCAHSFQKVKASIGVWLATKADTFTEAFSNSAGTEAGKRVIQGGALIALYPALHQLLTDLGGPAAHILKILFP